jgi:hypothetical protein
LFPQIPKEYCDSNTHRKFSDAPVLYIFVHPFVMPAILVFLQQQVAPLKFSP